MTMYMMSLLGMSHLSVSFYVVYEYTISVACFIVKMLY